MEIVQRALDPAPAQQSIIRLPVDRLLLAKRRWRGVAEDGREFGFDLQNALPDGATIFTTETTSYVLAQKYEPVLELSLSETGLHDPAQAARVGWLIGNLHFQIEVTPEVVRVMDDPAVRQMFEREGLPYTACKRVFHPLAGGHHH